MRERWRAALRNRKLMAALALVVFLLAVALWPEAVPVDLATVERGPLQVTVEDEGETRVRERFVISAPVAGRLRRIELEPADPVQRGQVVAVLQPAPPALLDARTRAEAAAAVEAAQAVLGRTQAERARAQAAAAQAASEMKRQGQLARSGIVSAEALERARTEAEAAEQALRAAQFAAASAGHELERAQAVLRQASGGGGGREVELRSPVGGTVLRRLRESEAVVPAGEPLLEVGDPREIEIVTDLLSADAVKVRPGQAVHIDQWGGDVPLRGRVRHVEPSGFMKVSALGVEEQRVNVIVDFEDPKQAQALGDGYRVEVRIVVWEVADAVKAPTSSLFRSGGEWAVFVADGGRARRRTVQIGSRNGLEAQVLGGLVPGEQVVVHPSDTLADGQRVEPRAAAFRPSPRAGVTAVAPAGQERHDQP
jgi:HlyD family secretion protein